MFAKEVPIKKYEKAYFLLIQYFYQKSVILQLLILLAFLTFFNLVAKHQKIN